MRRTQVVVGVAILTLGFHSVVPAIRATEPANPDVIMEPLAPDEEARFSLSLQTSGNLSLGAVSESPAQAAETSAEESRLAQQLANPIPSSIFVPFQANEDFGYGPSHNGYKFTLNMQPIVPFAISKDWNVFVRTIVPIVSQHDLFYIENLPGAPRACRGTGFVR